MISEIIKTIKTKTSMNSKINLNIGIERMKDYPNIDVFIKNIKSSA